MLIIGDFATKNYKWNVIIHHRRQDLQRIIELHPSFMALSYSLLFLHKGDGYKIGILHCPQPLCVSIKHERLTIKEYYTFRLHVRTDEAKILLLSKRLL